MTGESKKNKENAIRFPTCFLFVPMFFIFSPVIIQVFIATFCGYMDTHHKHDKRRGDFLRTLR